MALYKYPGLETGQGWTKIALEALTLLSLKVDLDPGGYLEDLGAILEVLGAMVITI